MAASEAGYAMAALLVGIAIMGIFASMAIPAWRAAAKREKEAELIFRAGQVAHAIEKFRRKVGGGAYPPDLDFLVRQKYLRKKYKDPMTKDGEWRIVTPQELQAGGVGTGRPGSSSPLPQGGATGGRGGFGSQSGSGSSGGFGSQSQPGTSPSGPGGLGSGSSTPGGLSPGGRTSSFGVDSPGGRTQNMGPVAAVASKSTEKSIRIFKGRDRYDQWVVTIEDVALRQRNGQQQPGQPGQPNRPGSRPGFGSPSGFGSSSPGSSTPGTGSPTPPRP